MTGATSAMPQTLFLATPLHDGKVHRAYLKGALELASSLPPGRLVVSGFTSQSVFVGRDVLTAHFLRSNATHLLCVDSDIGWGASDVQKLLLSGKDFVAGNYARKQQDRALVCVLRGAHEGPLREAESVGAGFVLLSRTCIERMIQAHPELEYATAHGPVWALWAPIFDGVPNGEDVSFCKRWRALGERIWVHSEVTLMHFGETVFLPRGKV